MSRYLIAVLIAAGLGYWAYSSWQEHLDSERVQQAGEARREALKNSVNELAKKVNAVTNWDTNLADNRKHRNTPVLTAELQEQWLINRPILFLGYIEDIAINQDRSYQITAKQNGITSRPTFIGTNIRVNLRCPESVATPLLRAARARTTIRFRADTAITAVIEDIITTSENDSEGGTDTVLTGVGKCLDAMYLK